MDIRDTPPNVQTLQLLLNDKKMSIRSIMNTSGELYRSMGLKDKIDSMSESELLKLLSENGMLIKRPLITDGRRATVSAKESVLNTWIA